MSGAVELTGMVLSAAPAGEYDKRLVILTRERGRITAFARSARKSSSPLLAAAVPFTFGTFKLYEGRSAYTLVQAQVKNYFEGLRQDYVGAYYGFYFMEFASYYTRENLDGTDVLNLLYAALKALENEKIEDELIRCAFEVRLMVMGGEFPQDVTQDESLLPASRYAFYHMMTKELSKLFAFTLREDVLKEVRERIDLIMKLTIDTKFKSLGILKVVAG